MSAPHVNRRQFVASGSAIAAGAWVAPSITGFDRVAAATGSCGTAPVQVDWSDYANDTTVPGSITANDGTVITITTADAWSVGHSTNFTVRNGTMGGLQDYLRTVMVGGNNGEYVQVRFNFSQPVQLCFTLLDVDRSSGNWEDTIVIRGRLSGTPVTLTPADMVTGPANTVIGNNRIRGILNNNTPSTSPDGNADVNYPSPIDRLVVRHRDDTSWTGLQWIGIHDFRWC